MATAQEFIQQLSSFPAQQSEKNGQFFRDENQPNKILGVRMASIFALAKTFINLPIEEIAALLQNEYYEVRMGAVSIMDFQAREKKRTAEHKRQLYELYISHHQYINNWDLVDRSAPYVIGGYLFDKSREPLYQLAKSQNVWERRTAIVSTYYFIRQDDLADTFKIAEILVNDPHDLIQKAVGSWVREAGKRNEPALLDFLDQHASKMPRVCLRYAIEKLNPDQKQKYLKA